MNHKISVPFLVLAFALFSGCESSRYKPAESLPGSYVRTPPPSLTLTETQLLERAAAQPAGDVPGDGWKPIFDGTLKGWRATDFSGGGRVELVNGLIVIGRGQPFSGINWTNEPVRTDYELSLEAMRISGADFFCGLTFPVRDTYCSLIVGGWGGSLVGLSSLDGADASENETTQFISFETGRWYRIRLRVTAEKIEAWVEQKKVVNVTTTGRKVALRFGDIEMSKPLGIAAWDTGAAVREIKLRAISTPDSPTEQ